MKGENNIFMLGVVVLIVMLAIATGAVDLSSVGLGSSVHGFTTMSLDEADFESSNEFFDGNVWILEVQQDGLGQYVTGTIEKEDIGDD